MKQPLMPTIGRGLAAVILAMVAVMVGTDLIRRRLARRRTAAAEAGAALVVIQVMAEPVVEIGSLATEMVGAGVVVVVAAVAAPTRIIPAILVAAVEASGF